MNAEYWMEWLAYYIGNLVTCPPYEREAYSCYASFCRAKMEMEEAIETVSKKGARHE